MMFTAFFLNSKGKKDVISFQAEGFKDAHLVFRKLAFCKYTKLVHIMQGVINDNIKVIWYNDSIELVKLDPTRSLDVKMAELLEGQYCMEWRQ